VELGFLVETMKDAFSLSDPIVRKITEIIQPIEAETEEEPDDSHDFEIRLDQCAAETGISADQLRKWMRLALQRGQLAITGAEGTGKTFLAEYLASLLIGSSDGLYELVQFHPGINYARFMGWTDINGTTHEGIFSAFCRQARKRRGTCVMVIDDISSVSLPEVFGELRYALDQRNKEITLGLDGSHFSVPENVVIIAGWNPRVSLDAGSAHFLRSRFAIVHLDPNPSLLHAFLNRFGEKGEALARVIDAIDETVADPDRRLGPAIFLREGDHLPDTLPDLWRYRVEPILEDAIPKAKRKGFLWEALSTDELKDWA
jgi:hypothetical protein